MGDRMMDNFELKPEPKVKRKPIIWNILTVIAILGTLCLLYYFIAIFISPNSTYNPFPPALLPTLFQTNTPTSTIIPQPPTWTPTETIQPTPTRTKAPTWTLLPQMITPSSTGTQATSTITTTAMPATVDITYATSTDLLPDTNCNWQGVGGKVIGPDGNPLAFQVVQMGGTLDGKLINFLTVSGTASVFGPAGFEFVLSEDHAAASVQTLWIQLLDNTTKPLTDKIYFDTYTDCGKNLVVVTFTITH
jgi:hypothetical protein